MAFPIRRLECMRCEALCLMALYLFRISGSEIEGNIRVSK